MHQFVRGLLCRSSLAARGLAVCHTLNIMKRCFWWIIGAITLMLAMFPSHEVNLPDENRNHESTSPKENPAYIAAWAALKRRMTVYNRVEISFLVLTFGYVIIAIAFKIRPAGWIMLPLAIIYLIARDVAGKYVNKFKCPRCGEQCIKIDPHSRSPFWEIDEKNRRGTRCKNCQLPLWAKTSET